jgi:hypothetical protein
MWRGLPGMELGILKPVLEFEVDFGYHFQKDWVL